MLDLVDVGKIYRSSAAATEIISSVTFSMSRGEILALFGPSGCGKTTLLRIISGLEEDYSGTCHLQPETKIGFIFQEPRLLPWRMVHDNIALVKPDNTQKELDQMLDTMGIAGMGHKYPHELSLGEARRVAIARALAIKPDLLLLDEAFVSLDRATSLSLQQSILQIFERSDISLILVSHDINEVARLADRVIMLSSRPARITAEIIANSKATKRDESEIASLMQKLRSSQHELNAN